MLKWLLLAWFLGTFPAAYLFGWIVRGLPGRSGMEPDKFDSGGGWIFFAAAFWPLAIPILAVVSLFARGSPWGYLNRAGYARRARSLDVNPPKENT